MKEFALLLVGAFCFFFFFCVCRGHHFIEFSVRLAYIHCDHESEMQAEDSVCKRSLVVDKMRNIDLAVDHPNFTFDSSEAKKKPTLHFFNVVYRFGPKRSRCFSVSFQLY